MEQRRLELIHAGRLYPYRDPRPLLQALAAVPEVRLTLILPDVPGTWVQPALAAAGRQVRILGPMTPAAVQATLAKADVLVHFGDVHGSVQIPAKLYACLGVPRPLLHLVQHTPDVVAEFLNPLARGWQVPATPVALPPLLKKLWQAKQFGQLDRGVVLHPLDAYGWSALGRALAEKIAALAPFTDRA